MTGPFLISCIHKLRFCISKIAPRHRSQIVAHLAVGISAQNSRCLKQIGLPHGWESPPRQPRCLANGKPLPGWGEDLDHHSRDLALCGDHRREAVGARDPEAVIDDLQASWSLQPLEPQRPNSRRVRQRRELLRRRSDSSDSEDDSRMPWKQKQNTGRNRTGEGR